MDSLNVLFAEKEFITSILLQKLDVFDIFKNSVDTPTYNYFLEQCFTLMEPHLKKNNINTIKSLRNFDNKSSEVHRYFSIFPNKDSIYDRIHNSSSNSDEYRYLPINSETNMDEIFVAFNEEFRVCSIFIKFDFIHKYTDYLYKLNKSNALDFRYITIYIENSEYYIEFGCYYKVNDSCNLLEYNEDLNGDFKIQTFVSDEKFYKDISNLKTYVNLYTIISNIYKDLSFTLDITTDYDLHPKNFSLKLNDKLFVFDYSSSDKNIRDLI